MPLLAKLPVVVKARPPRTLKLPLFVSEAGVDPGAWKNAGYKSFDYGLREMAQYQDLFKYAQPQAVMYWEFTGDYSLFAPAKADARKNNRLTGDDETERFALHRHWIEFIPPESEALEVTGAKPYVELNAFKHEKALTLQLSNTGWPRVAVIRGLGGLGEGTKLNVIQTSRGKLMQRQAPIEIKNGVVEFDMPSQSMTTLTTR